MRKIIAFSIFIVAACVAVLFFSVFATKTATEAIDTDPAPAVSSEPLENNSMQNPEDTLSSSP